MYPSLGGKPSAAPDGQSGTLFRRIWSCSTSRGRDTWITVLFRFAGAGFFLQCAFKLPDAISEPFAQIGQFARTEEQQSDDQDHQQVHRLHNAFKHESSKLLVNSTVMLVSACDLAQPPKNYAAGGLCLH